MSVRGIERVRSNVRSSVAEIRGRKTEAALYAVLSQGAAIAQTMTPIDTSNLINSQYAPVIASNSGGMYGNIGYTAHYAAAVHEKPGTLKGLPRENGNDTYWSPDAEPKFLTKGFEELKPSIPRILREVYRV